MTEEPDDERDPTVLTPEELALEEERGVERIDENRFVVSPSGDRSESTPPGEDDTEQSVDAGPELHRIDPGQEDDAAHSERGVATPAKEGPTPPPPAHTESDHAAAEDRDRDRQTSINDPVDGPSISPAVRRAAIDRIEQPHAVDIMLKADGAIVERRITAEDRITAFEELLTWYASTIDDDNPPAATISALLAEADLTS